MNPQEPVERIVSSLTVVTELSILERIVTMEIINMEMDVPLTVSLNVETEESMLENNVILELLSTTKSSPTDADLDASSTLVVMELRIPMNNVILELPTLTPSEMLAVRTVETHTVVMVLSITTNNAIPDSTLSVPATVLPLLPLVVMEESTQERLVMPELETLKLLLDAELTVLSHTVVMVSVIKELFQLVLPLLKFTMKLVIFQEEQPHATLKHAPTLVVMEP